MAEKYFKQLDENNPGLFARQDIPKGTRMIKISDSSSEFNAVKDSTIFAQIGEDSVRSYVDLKNCQVKNLIDSER